MNQLNNVDGQIHQILSKILHSGTFSKDRTGVGTYRTFGVTMRSDLKDGFPLCTTRKMYFKGIWYELYWMMSLHFKDNPIYNYLGYDNIKFLVDHDVNIWNAWPLEAYNKKNPNNTLTESEFVERIKTDVDFAERWGYLGRIYGTQWRNFQSQTGTIDQLAECIDLLKHNPDSRRIKIGAWNAADFIHSPVALPCCHYDITFNSVLKEDGKRYLNCIFNMRSSDFFIAGNWNYSFYAILTHLLATLSGHEVGELMYVAADCHLYSNHIEAVSKQLSRTESFDLPTLYVNPNIKHLNDITLDCVKLQNYQSHGKISAPVAV